MEGQMSIYDFLQPIKKSDLKYKIKKPVRLVETFSGIGSQFLALKRLGVDVTSWKSIEFDKYAMNSFNAIHGTNYEPTDICTVKGGDLSIVETDKYDYILTYSFPCT